MDGRGDRAGGGERGGDSSGSTGRKMLPSKWSDRNPNDDNIPPRGGDRFGGGGGGVGGLGGRGGRFHPYSGSQDRPAGGGDGPVFRGGPPGGFGHQGPMGSSGPRRGFSRRGDSPGQDGNKLVKLFIRAVPRTVTEEDILPLFEEHGNVIEVALIRDWKSAEQQEEGKVVGTTNSWLLISVDNLDFHTSCATTTQCSRENFTRYIKHILAVGLSLKYCSPYNCSGYSCANSVLQCTDNHAFFDGC